MKSIHVWDVHEPSKFDFGVLAKQGWEIEQGKLQFHVTEARMLVANHITGPNETWRDMSRQFRGLLVYNVDYEVNLDDDTISNMIRADVVTVPTEDFRMEVLRVTELPRDQVLVVPQSQSSKEIFWSTLPERKLW